MRRSSKSVSFWKHVALVLVPAAIMLLALNSPSCGATLNRSLAVPSYFEPGSLWTEMENGYPTVRTVVLNPVNGPGSVVKPGYAGQVEESQAAGLEVLGYVHTGYGARGIPEVKADIDRYYSWYGVDGIFLDEASTDCQLAQGYYRDLYRYVKAKDPEGKIALNPGMPTGECYMKVADVVVTFEGSYESYVDNYSAPGWVGKYAPARFWHLIHSTPTIGNMERAVRLSKERDAGWVYVTPDTLPNPWDTLPPETYWSRELSAIGSGE